MAQPPGRRLERLVAAMHHAESNGATVVWNDEINGRQFDVTIRFKFGLHNYLTVVECKDYSAKVSLDKVDAFVTKARDAKANKAILISSEGFQSGCLPVAERHGIQLLVLSETTETTTSDLIRRFTPGLRIYDVFFKHDQTGAKFGLEDWGGRLAYLMSRSRLVSQQGEQTPNQLIEKWKLATPVTTLEEQTNVEIPLASGSKFFEPLGQAVPVSAMQFTCSVVELAVPVHPMPDNHILQSYQTRVELRDTTGEVLHSLPLNDLPLGYDTSVKPGHFYELPSMFSRYFCEKIEGDLVTWTLVESYQHGMLVQAKLTQKLKYSIHYVLVTDNNVLDRLRKLLAYLRTVKKDLPLHSTRSK